MATRTGSGSLPVPSDLAPSTYPAPPQFTAPPPLAQPPPVPALPVAAPVAWGTATATGVPGDDGERGRRGIWIAAVVVGGVVALALIAVLGMFAWRATSRPTASSTTTTQQTTTTRPATTTPTTTPALAPTVPATNPPPPTTNSTGLATGLMCRDLADRGLPYAAAVGYWYAEGRPERMDADRNGIPCETVYPASAVAAYWGPALNHGYAAGMTCANLRDAGASYAEAVDYWFAQGMPSRMDADSNGVPCETVYDPDEVAAYWSGID